jgi:hypothetical protein
MTNRNIDTNYDAAGLRAEETVDGWSVLDTHDGQSRWWPSADARAEIEQSINPSRTAVRICATEPMRGTWSN